MPDITVRDIMRTEVITVAPSDAVAKVAQALDSSGLSGVPVVENGEVVGIITETDIIQRQADVSMPTYVSFWDRIFVLDVGPDYEEEIRHVLATDARSLMTHPVYNIRDNATLEEVATVMIDHGIGVLPVLDPANQLVGIVTRKDLVKMIAKLENDETSE
ncbi:CBS domain-containing protein [soil metagenome]